MPRPVSQELVSACVDAQQRSLRLLDAADNRIDTARQSNSPAEMRAAVNELQRVLLDARTELGRCAALQQAAAAADPPAGHTMPDTPTAPSSSPGTRGTQPVSPAPAANPHAGHMMTTAANPATSVANLMCSTKVDPAKAPRATYQGTTYYFCSENDRQEFLKNPAQHAPSK